MMDGKKKERKKTQDGVGVQVDSYSVEARKDTGGQKGERQKERANDWAQWLTVQRRMSLKMFLPSFRRCLSGAKKKWGEDEDEEGALPLPRLQLQSCST